jgi:hypothetical protein
MFLVRLFLFLAILAIAAAVITVGASDSQIQMAFGAAAPEFVGTLRGSVTAEDRVPFLVAAIGVAIIVALLLLASRPRRVSVQTRDLSRAASARQGAPVLPMPVDDGLPSSPRSSVNDGDTQDRLRGESVASAPVPTPTAGPPATTGSIAGAIGAIIGIGMIVLVGWAIVRQMSSALGGDYTVLETWFSDERGIGRRVRNDTSRQLGILMSVTFTDDAGNSRGSASDYELVSPGATVVLAVEVPLLATRANVDLKSH